MTREQEIIIIAEIETAGRVSDGHLTNGSVYALLTVIRTWGERMYKQGWDDAKREQNN